MANKLADRVPDATPGPNTPNHHTIPLGDFAMFGQTVDKRRHILSISK